MFTLIKFIFLSKILDKYLSHDHWLLIYHRLSAGLLRIVRLQEKAD